MFCWTPILLIPEHSSFYKLMSYEV